MTTGKLEPAVGRLLVTPDNNVWVIDVVHPDGRVDLTDPYGTDELYNTRFLPDDGEWVARDITTVEAWARLTGVNLR